GNVGASGQAAQIRARLSRDNPVTPTPSPTPSGSGPTPSTSGPTPTGPRPSGPTPTGPTPTGPRPSTSGSTTPTPTGSGTPTPTPSTSGTPGDPQLALKLKYVHQDEQKTLTFEYHRQEAVQRSYAPQGLLGLLLRDLADREKHFVEVDLDDPFFRVFTVLVDAPIDFARLGLVEAHVALDYGDATDEPNHKHADFVFDAQNHARQQFQVFMNPAMDTSYTYAVEYHFDPESSWAGGKYTYQMPAQRTENRTLLLNPFEHLGFLEVNVYPQRIDSQVVLSTDVHLSQAQPDGTVAEKVINVTASSPPQLWRLRTDDPNNRTYTYYMVHNLKGGATRQTAPVTTDATLLPVDDPFDNSIDINFIPLFDATQVREVFIDVEYNDPANNYHRQERLTMTGTTRDALLLRIAVYDPSLMTYRYRATYVMAGTMNRGDFVETTETLIGLFG
ncbi:MAG TPA: hypothetical protein VFF06_10045, partial [Polyangia bacterium]|nr:hypothetical protein [Polyangia bacterium]